MTLKQSVEKDEGMNPHLGDGKFGIMPIAALRNIFAWLAQFSGSKEIGEMQEATQDEKDLWINYFSNEE